MNELSIEEKAKRYDEAIEKAEKALEVCGTDKCETARQIFSIFPELRESEDERIRKEIVSAINIYCSEYLRGTKVRNDMLTWLEKQGESYTKRDVDDAYVEGMAFAKDELEKQGEQLSAIRWYDVSLIPQEMKELLVEWDSEDATWHEIAFYHADNKTFWNGTRQVENVTRWCYIIDLLEKQGGQNESDVKDYNSIDPHFGKPIDKIEPTDNVEPKFNKGDWMVLYVTENIYQVVAVIDNYYQLKYGDNYTIQKCADVDRCARLWDITKDTKKGDVLSDGTTIFIFKDLLSDGSVMSYCDYDTDSGESDAFCPLPMNLMCSKITPATKEQRDTLEKAMADAGYKWDKEKLKLGKI